MRGPGDRERERTFSRAIGQSGGDSIAQDDPVQYGRFQRKAVYPIGRIVPDLSEDSDLVRLVVSKYLGEFAGPRYDITCKVTLRKNRCRNAVPHVTLECQ